MAKQKEKVQQAHRERFWNYCIQTATAAKVRAKNKNVPYDIDARFIDQLLVDQKWCCAVSGLAFWPPRLMGRKSRPDAFGPSLDRIVPELGYVPGNVRVVNNLVNVAMQEWGLDAFLAVVEATATNRNVTKTSDGKRAAVRRLSE